MTAQLYTYTYFCVLNVQKTEFLRAPLPSEPQENTNSCFREGTQSHLRITTKAFSTHQPTNIENLFQLTVRNKFREMYAEKKERFNTNGKYSFFRYLHDTRLPPPYYCVRIIQIGNPPVRIYTIRKK